MRWWNQIFFALLVDKEISRYRYERWQRREPFSLVILWSSLAFFHFSHNSRCNLVRFSGIQLIPLRPLQLSWVSFTKFSHHLNINFNQASPRCREKSEKIFESSQCSAKCTRVNFFIISHANYFSLRQYSPTEYWILIQLMTLTQLWRFWWFWRTFQFREGVKASNGWITYVNDSTIPFDSPRITTIRCLVKRSGEGGWRVEKWCVNEIFIFLAKPSGRPHVELMKI